MIASVDEYLGRRFDPERYDCLHFAREVWRAATGEDLEERLPGFFGAASARRLAPGLFKPFRRLETPSEPCLVLLQRPGCAVPHVGVFVLGKLLHLRPSGPTHEDLGDAAIGFTRVRCFA